MEIEKTTDKFNRFFELKEQKQRDILNLSLEERYLKKMILELNNIHTFRHILQSFKGDDFFIFLKNLINLLKKDEEIFGSDHKKSQNVNFFDYNKDEEGNIEILFSIITFDYISIDELVKFLKSNNVSNAKICFANCTFSKDFIDYFMKHEINDGTINIEKLNIILNFNNITLKDINIQHKNQSTIFKNLLNKGVLAKNNAIYKNCKFSNEFLQNIINEELERKKKEIIKCTENAKKINEYKEQIKEDVKKELQTEYNEEEIEQILEEEIEYRAIVDLELEDYRDYKKKLDKIKQDIKNEIQQSMGENYDEELIEQEFSDEINEKAIDEHLEMELYNNSHILDFIDMSANSDIATIEFLKQRSGITVNNFGQIVSGSLKKELLKNIKFNPSFVKLILTTGVPELGIAQGDLSDFCFIENITFTQQPLSLVMHNLKKAQNTTFHNCLLNADDIELFINAGTRNFDSIVFNNRKNLNKINYNFRKCSFIRAKFCDKTYEKIDFTGSDFTGANLSYANFSGATLTDVVMKDVILYKTKFDLKQLQAIFAGQIDKNKIKNIDIKDLTQKELQQLDFTGIDISTFIVGFDFIKLILEGKIKGREKGDLSGLILHLSKTNYKIFLNKLSQKANLTNCKLDITNDVDDRIIDNQNFVKLVANNQIAGMDFTFFKNRTLFDIDFTKINLLSKNIDFTYVYLRNCKINQKQAQQIIDGKVKGRKQGDFTGMNLAEVDFSKIKFPDNISICLNKAILKVEQIEFLLNKLQYVQEESLRNLYDIIFDKNNPKDIETIFKFICCFGIPECILNRYNKSGLDISNIDLKTISEQYNLNLNLNVLKFFTISKEQLGLILQGKIQNIKPEEYNCFNLEKISETDIKILKEQYLKPQRIVQYTNPNDSMLKFDIDENLLQLTRQFNLSLSDFRANTNSRIQPRHTTVPQPTNRTFQQPFRQTHNLFSNNTGKQQFGQRISQIPVYPNVNVRQQTLMQLEQVNNQFNNIINGQIERRQNNNETQRNTEQRQQTTEEQRQLLNRMQTVGHLFKDDPNLGPDY